MACLFPPPRIQVCHSTPARLIDFGLVGLIVLDWTPVTTGPYAIHNGATLYEGNVYLSIVKPYAHDNCGNLIGEMPRPAGADILTLASSYIYTMRGWVHQGSGFPLNFADFNTPVPYR